MYRDAQSLRVYFENLKKTARKQAVDDKLAIFKTGGGPSEAPKTDSVMEFTLSLLNPKTVHGLPNDADCNEPEAEIQIPSSPVPGPSGLNKFVEEIPLEIEDEVDLETFLAEKTSTPQNPKKQNFFSPISEKITPKIYAGRRRPISSRTELTSVYHNLAEEKINFIKVQKEILLKKK